MSARTDPCGGYRVTGIPTATATHDSSEGAALIGTLVSKTKRKPCLFVLMGRPDG